jgi:hypothetical protein
MEQKPEDNLTILGHVVKDKVTKFKGTATSVCFDLYGCIQVSVCSEANPKKGRAAETKWFDIDRLKQVGKERTMEPPKDWLPKGCQAERPNV